ncbi:MAG: hypothetical protein AAFU79_08735 [Myxococcota bacterium]
MKTRMLTFSLLAVGLTGASACGSDEDAAEGALAYYAHPCGRGDPVSQMCAAGDALLELEDPAVARCSDRTIAEGDSCSTEGERCVQLPAQACTSSPTASINSAAYLTCRSEALPADTACPRSSVAVKKHVQHVDTAVRAAIAQTMLATKLAKYTYVSPSVGDTAPQLGFMIEELGDAPYVLHSDGAHVNVYGYASAILATVQEQQRAIEKLKATVEKLERQCR